MALLIIVTHVLYVFLSFFFFSSARHLVGKISRCFARQDKYREGEKHERMQTLYMITLDLELRNDPIVKCNEMS